MLKQIHTELPLPNQNTFIKSCFSLSPELIAFLMDFSSFRMALASHSSYPLWPLDIFWSILWEERILIADRGNHTNISAVLLQAEAELENRREGGEIPFLSTDMERKNDIKIPIQIQFNPWQKCQKVIADNTAKIPIPTITLCSIKQLLDTPFIVITVCAPYRSRIYFK